MTLLQTIITHPPRYSTTKKGKPCGHGNQPMCVPLTDYMFVLVVFAVVLAYGRLTKQKLFR
jgi:hypothetical protein